jgi:hypothetical protein
MIKGTKHSAETLLKIRENTKLAMKKPSIRRKVSKGWFKKGNKAWNKDKSVRLSPKTEWKVGDTAGCKNMNWKGGVQLPAKDCAYWYGGVGLRYRKPRKIFEDFLGRKLSKKEIVYHLNGDNKDDRLANLILIDRAILIKLNQNKKKVKA